MPIAKTYSGPPADRMVGRPSRNALTAKAERKISDKTVARASSYLAREDLLDHAVHAGVINAGMRSHYAAAYDADPAGTREFLGKLGLRSEASAAPEDYPDSMLTDSERANLAAAREGRQPNRIVNGG
jgi:hypothetical protein